MDPSPQDISSNAMNSRTVDQTRADRQQAVRLENQITPVERQVALDEGEQETDFGRQSALDEGEKEGNIGTQSALDDRTGELESGTTGQILRPAGGVSAEQPTRTSNTSSSMDEILGRMKRNFALHAREAEEAWPRIDATMDAFRARRQEEQANKREMRQTIEELTYENRRLNHIIDAVAKRWVKTKVAWRVERRRAALFSQADDPLDLVDEPWEELALEPLSRQAATADCCSFDATFHLSRSLPLGSMTRTYCFIKRG